MTTENKQEINVPQTDAPEQEKTEQKEQTEQKVLTPQELQQRKKMIIFPLLFLLFAGCMWLIFAPSTEEEKEHTVGFNTELPTPKDGKIVSDKRDAYLQEAMEAKQQDKMRSLQDFSFSLSNDSEPGSNNEKVQMSLPPEPLSRGNSSGASRVNAFQSSAAQHQDINRQLGSFYEQPASQADEQAELELQWRLQELERKLEEQELEKNAADEQLALIEKSYQIAAKYMPAGTGQTENTSLSQRISDGNVKGGTKKVKPEAITHVSKNVVSLLSVPISNQEFAEQYSKPRNWNFNTVAGNELQTEKNSISACVNQTVTVTDGQEVQFRLLESMRAGDHIIPVNTLVSGSARISGERMNIMIDFIQHAGNVIPVEIVVFDLDGNPGINVPGSEEITTMKEIAANMGTSMGSSITITDDAGSQLLADLGRSAVQGVSQYMGKKMRTIKITLKAGHRVLLLPPMQ